MSSYRLVIRPEADAELAEATRWYDVRERGLGREFLRAFRAATSTLQRNPFIYQIVVGGSNLLRVRVSPRAWKR